MSVLSKMHSTGGGAVIGSAAAESFLKRLLGQDWSFGYNCYEVGHTWTPSCTDAALELSTGAALKVLPLYAALYTFNQFAVQQKFDWTTTLESVESTLRSSAFIFFHAYNGSALGCALRRVFGRFYYRVLVCIPAIFSCYLALAIEKPSRRQGLAFYMLNLASEIVYRMLVTKGYFAPIRYGETLLFSVSLAAWFYLIKTVGFGNDPVSAAVKLVIGSVEAAKRTRPDKGSGADLDALLELESPKLGSDVDTVKTNDHSKSTHQTLFDALAIEFVGPKHETCPHREPSCLAYALNKVPSRFALGYIIQTVLKLSSRPELLLTNPGKAVWQSFACRSSLYFGLFFATLVSSGRVVSCSLRHYSNSNTVGWHAPVAGFVSGLSMLWAPRSSITMYIMWKAVEQYYLRAARAGHVKHVDFTMMTVYSCSAATILYTFALEPRFIRPSYMKFLDAISDHRLHQLNRMVLDVFGTGSSIGYEDYFPDLHPNYMSREFKELIFNWLIQPY